MTQPFSNSKILTGLFTVIINKTWQVITWKIMNGHITQEKNVEENITQN